MTDPHHWHGADDIPPDPKPTTMTCPSCGAVIPGMRDAIVELAWRDSQLGQYDAALVAARERIAELEAERDAHQKMGAEAILRNVKLQKMAEEADAQWDAEIRAGENAVARIAELEAERDRADFSIVVELRERVAALEAERDEWKRVAHQHVNTDSKLTDACERIAALEAERDAFRQRVAELGLLEENLESYKTQWKRHLDEENDKFMRSKQNEAFDALYRLGELLALDEWSAGTLVDEVEKRLSRVAELEAANTRMWADYEVKRDRVAELEAERVASQELVETIEDALSNGLTKRAKIVNALSKWRRTRDQAALVVALQEEK